MIEGEYPRPKAIASDYDGTLGVNKDGALPSPRVTQAILRVKKEVPFSLVTGRPSVEARYIYKNLDLQDPCVFSNGAQVVDTKTEQTLWEKPIERDDLIGIRDLLADFRVRSYVVDQGHYNRDWYKRSTKISDIKSPLTIFTRGMEKRKADDLVEFLKALFGTRVAVHQFMSRIDKKPAVMLMHEQATKLHGVLVLKEQLGIDPEHFMGMGDGENDEPLLFACGIKVAIGSGNRKLIDYVREYQDTGHGFVTPPFSEDGAATALDLYIPEN